MATLSDKIVIVGAGCFGVSSAYHLLKRGFTDVTILDRSPILPAPDAASNDINRIVRSSYSDVFYAKLAREAIVAWKNRSEWRDTYKESGVLVLGLTENEAYADKGYQNDIALGATLTQVADTVIRSAFPSKVPTAAFDSRSGYLNKEGGWADAGQGITIMIDTVVSLGCKVLPGKSVRRITRNTGGKTNGVECEDGTFYEAATVIIASGSWTPSTFPDVTFGHTSGLSTGQCVAMIQLSEEEAEIYKDIPVVLDFETGFYIFPPTRKGIVKMAMHLAGYTHSNGGEISRPRTIIDDPIRGLAIPKYNVQQLRTHLRMVYPELAGKPFSATRLCWYNDSPDGNWIIGRVPGDPSLILATAGSGHAYKFLPVIGRLVADTVDGTIDPEVAAKFSIERSYVAVDESRLEMAVAELDLDQLCTLEDLQINSKT
ncbi:L-pipecolate oxidase [Termitomyces sp. T112]|nr:L-pipecolate oxidase [Termitomyces sp. T112]